MADENLNIHLNAKDNATQVLDKVGKNFKSLKDRMSEGWTALAAKVYLFQKGLRVVTGVMSAVISAAEEQEDSLLRLNNALMLQGTYTDELSLKYQNYAKELQKSTRYGDEAIQDAMQSLIAIGNVSTSQLPRATQAVLDFSTATGRDLKTASMTVAKAAAGFTGELSRYGIIIDENIPKSEKFEKTLQFIEKRFGKSAQKDVNTYSGAVAQVSNSWGDFTEELGKFITESPGVKKDLGTIKTLLDSLSTSTAKAREEMAKPEFQKNVSKVAKITMDVFFPILKFHQDLLKVINNVGKKEDEVLDGISHKGATFEPIMIDQKKPKQESEVIKGFNAGMQSVRDQYSGLAGSIERSTIKFAGAAENSLSTLFFDPATKKFGKLKDVAADFGTQVLGILSNLAAQWALFGFSGKGGLLGSFGVKGYATGTSYIPQTGMYKLHKGEKVTPEHETNRSGNSGGDTKIIVIQAWDVQDVARNIKTVLGGLYEDVSSNGEGRAILKKYLQ